MNIYILTFASKDDCSSNSESFIESKRTLSSDDSIIAFRPLEYYTQMFLCNKSFSVTIVILFCFLTSCNLVFFAIF